MSTVLVTGGSGFIGSHCILQLSGCGPSGAQHGAELKREDNVRALLKQGARSRASACPSSPPIWNRMRAGRTPSPAATTCCMWPRPFLRASQERGRTDRCRARRRAARAACCARRRRQTGGADSSYAGDWLRPQAATGTVQRDDWTPARPGVSAYASRRAWPSARPGISSPKRAVVSNCPPSIR